MPPIVALQRAEGVIIEDQGLLVSYWVEAWGRECIQDFFSVFGSVRARQPKGVGQLMVFRTDGIDARRFGDEVARKDLGRLHTTFDGYFRGTAIVLEGGGFVAAALRSSAWALTSLFRIKTAPKYHPTVDDAVLHLGASLADLGVTKASLQRAVDLARSTVTGTRSTP